MVAATVSWIVVMTGSAHALAAEAARATVCFGGPPTTVATGESKPSQPTIVGDALYWLAGGEVRRLSLATSAKTTVARTGGIDIKVFDGTLAVGATNINNLEAIDLPGGQPRVLVEGHTTMEQPLLFSSLALDDKYVYFGRGENEPPFASSPRIGFHRVPRTGTAAPESLGRAPDGQTTFAVADGFVYWRSFHRMQGSDKYVIELSRRRLQKDAPVQVITALRAGGKSPLAIHGGRVYYADIDEIRSVPVAGGAPPVTHATTGNQSVVDLVADDRCVYWLNAAGVLQRAQGERGAVERIATLPPEAERWGTGPHPALATDGARLYWADANSGSIVAVGRVASVADTGLRTVAARPASAQAGRRDGTDRLLVGTGWGCARRGRRGARQVQCWQVPAVAGAAAPIVRARPVPWLAADHYAATADRLCALTDNGPRCWRPAELFGPAPTSVSFAPMSPRTIYDVELAAGGDVTCTEKDNIWSCSGDDSFGQLGNGAPGEAHNRLFGGHIALSAFHGCVSGESVLCWGRNDTLQLGFASTESCQVGGRDIPCSRAAKPPSYPLPRAPAVYAGDTFTCVRRGDVHCWGASRDGLFGTGEACPSGLKAAFPTRSGPVAAPNATCSAAPAELPAFPAGKQQPVYSFAVGSRGACAVVGRYIKCAGAIPTPPQLAGEQFGPGTSGSVVVSRGDDPSACALTGGDVTCWGAGYSPPASPDRPLQITFASIAVDGPAVDSAVPDGAKWPANCAINDGCPPQALPRCPAGLAAGAVAWSALARNAAESSGRQVIVRGPLLVQASVDVATSPPQSCSPADPLPIVIGKNTNPLLVDGLACNGDESRRCCAAPALGQDVIARGQLAASGSHWILRNPQLCSAR